MKYQKSEWYKGLLFAEEQSALGWRVCAFDYSESWFVWEWPEDFASKQETLPAEFQQVLADNVWELYEK